jgi:hypothetical protein
MKEEEEEPKINLPLVVVVWGHTQFRFKAERRKFARTFQVCAVKSVIFVVAFVT